VPGRAVVFGRDLRANAALQQKLINAQQAMERDYWRLRHMETRYRALFQVAGEAVLIVESSSGQLEEANPAAVALFGAETVRPGWLVADGFAPEDVPAVKLMLDGVRATGQNASVPAGIPGQAGKVQVSASLFRYEKGAHLLLRVTSGRAPGQAEQAGRDSLALKLLDQAPDAFVVTDPDGRVLAVNQAFLALAQLPTELQARGQLLETWLGRTGVDLSVLISNLRQRGAVRLFSTVMRGQSGGVTDVEISAVAVNGGDTPCIGFTIRDVSRRLTGESRADRALPRSVGQMTELVGRVPLKDIVRDTADLIEQLCIEAALELTHDNRASAAEMLGLSRQSLYVKLRRFNLGDLTPASNNGE
jgi:transcriptional regulator PpsR